MKPYRFHPDALAELLEVLRWYDERFPAAAMVLESAIEDAIDAIRRAPLASPPMAGADIRARNLRTYGYSVVYEVGDGIIILAIAHQRRRPQYWLSRAGRR